MKKETYKKIYVEPQTIVVALRNKACILNVSPVNNYDIKGADDDSGYQKVDDLGW